MLNLDSKLIASWEEKTSLFGAYLVEKGIQSSTLRSYFSAIKHVLKLDSYEWDDNKVLLSSLVRGCRIINDKVKTRLPIQKGLLEMLLFEIERKFNSNNQQPYLICLYKAIFSLAYYGMLRVGELSYSNHTIKACNIHVGSNKDKILIVLYSSKTHGKESRPQKVKISALPNFKKTQKILFCPFELIIQYMKIRGDYYNDNEQFFVFSYGSPVKPNNIRSLLRELLNDLGLNSKLYDVHSFRSGRTVDLEKYGYNMDRIKSMGRWRSNAVYKYLKN